MFRGCRLQMTGDEMQAKEAYVILTASTDVDQSQIIKYLTENRTMNYLKYKEFDDQLVCGCSDLEFYINECHAKLENYVSFESICVMIAVFSMVLMFVNSVRMYKRGA